MINKDFEAYSDFLEIQYKLDQIIAETSITSPDQKLAKALMRTIDNFKEKELA